jgi:mRNA-degrading endonuclease RelE of RelBE toxin-antitoxin system
MQPSPITMGRMAESHSYKLVYAREVAKHLESIESKYDRLIRHKIEEQLTFEPGVEAKNRKPMRQPAPFAAQWEIRFGPGNRFRVLYDIDQEGREVQILAIGEKRGNRLIIGGEEVEA